MSTFAVLTAAAVVMGLAGCTEHPQTGGGVKGDAPAYQGVSNGFEAPNWKAGDRASWEERLKTRAQNSQNEYTKMVTPK